MKDPPNEVIVKNFDVKGNESFNDLQLRIILSTQNNYYEQEVVSKSGKRYKLFTIHNFYESLPLEHWIFELREIQSKNKKKEKLGFNLFDGIQVKPKELETNRGGLIGYLYPEEKATHFTPDGEPLYGYGQKSFYFFKTIRKIQIENFCVIIKVENYQFNKAKPTNLDLFEVIVRFNSSCEVD
jgi:hypothetical protein